MPESLIDLAFGAATLNNPQMVEKFGSLKYDMYAQELFAKGRDISPETGDVARWYEMQLSRAPAPYTGKRSPAVTLEGVGGDLKTCVVADIRISTDPIPLDEITSERAAQNWLAAEYKDKRKRLAISREIFAWMALKGAVTINGTTIPGSNISFAFTQGVTPLAPAASWATDTTKIASTELDRHHTTYHDACGLEMRRLVIDSNVQKYLRQNTEVQANVAANPNPDKSRTVNGPMGRSFEWEGLEVDVTRSKYSKAGTLTKYLGDDGLIALPDDSELSLVLARAEAHGTIPREAIGSGEIGAVQGMGLKAPNRGEYTYAYTTPNPGAVVVVFGCRVFYVLTFPEAVGYDDSVITP